jgi:hypothetical protein
MGDNHNKEIIMGRNLHNKLIVLLDNSPQNLVGVCGARPVIRLPGP